MPFRIHQGANVTPRGSVKAREVRGGMPCIFRVTFLVCTFVGTSAALNGCGGKTSSEPLTVIKYAEDVKRLTLGRQLIDYSRFADSPTCKLECDWNANEGVPVVVGVPPSSVMAMLLGQCDCGVPVEPLNALYAYCQLCFQDSEGRSKGRVMFHRTRQDETVISVNEKWYVLDTEPERMCEELRALAATKTTTREL